MQKLLPPVLLAVLVALMAVTHIGFRVPVVVPSELRHGAVALVLLGVAIAVAARVQFARSRMTVHTFAAPERLVTGGLFRMSRNPMYLGLGLVAVGCGIACGAATSLVLGVLFVAITDRWYIPFEERMMKATFGADFERYARATRRWL